MNKYLLITLAILSALALWPGCAPQDKPNRDILFQVSTIPALMMGVYDGSITIGELAKYGDFGIGTLANLDGEMVELDGKFYQVKLDGTVSPVPDDAKTPFAEVTYFDDDHTFTLDKPLDLNQLQAYIDTLLPTTNIFFMPSG